MTFNIFLLVSDDCLLIWAVLCISQIHFISKCQLFCSPFSFNFNPIIFRHIELKFGVLQARVMHKCIVQVLLFQFGTFMSKSKKDFLILPVVIYEFWIPEDFGMVADKLFWCFVGVCLCWHGETTDIRRKHREHPHSVQQVGEIPVSLHLSKLQSPMCTQSYCQPCQASVLLHLF